MQKILQNYQIGSSTTSINTIYVIITVVISIIVTNVIYTFFSKILKKNKLEILENKSFLKKIRPTKELMAYIFWMLIGVVFLIYFISMRFFNSWQNLYYILNTNLDQLKDDSYEYSIIFSKALLLDLCPFMALALCVSFILDWKGKVTSYFAPFCILGGLVTLPFIFFSEQNTSFNLNFIFIGTTLNPLYFMLHFFLVIFGILALRRNKNPVFFEIFYLHIIAIVFFSYVLIISRSLNVTYNVTGTNINDWVSPNGEYKMVKSILNLDFPWVLIISFSFAYLIINGMWVLKVLIHKKIFNSIWEKVTNLKIKK